MPLSRSRKNPGHVIDLHDKARGADVWIVPGDRVGSKPSRLSWAFRLDDGSLFTEAQHRTGLAECKAYMTWLLKRKRVATAARRMSTLQSLRRWMHANDCASFDELGPDETNAFRMVLDSDDRKRQAKSLLSDLEALRRLVGDDRPVFDEQSWHTKRSVVTIKPLPDEVAVLILNTSARLLHPNVIGDLDCALEIFLRHRGRKIGNYWTGQISARNRLKAFQFAALPGEGSPWHTKLGARNLQTPKYTRDCLNTLRNLIIDVSISAVIIICACTGMRLSELCSLMTGWDAESNLPSIIKVSRSASGLYDHFFIEAKVSKGRDKPVPHRFFAGAREAGSSAEPIVVHAVRMLLKLWRRWYSEDGSSKLLIRFERAIPDAGEQLPFWSDRALMQDLTAFLRRNINFSQLPARSASSRARGSLDQYRENGPSNVRFAQFRKTLGVFVIQCDPTLLPALQMHFKHTNIAMTEGHYVNECETLFANVHDIRQQITSAKLYQLTKGFLPGRGRIVDRVARLREDLEKLIGSIPRPEAEDILLKFGKSHNLLIWEAKHGDCLPIDRSEMRCHQAAGSMGLFGGEPNYAHRSHETCMSCECFLLGQQHVAYWQERHAWYKNYLDASVGQPEANLVVARARLKQAQALLKQIGLEPGSDV